MAELKSNAWILPFIGGIISLFSILVFPSARKPVFEITNINNSIWMWGLGCKGEFLPLITCAFFIIFGSIWLIISSLRVKRDQTKLEKERKKWLYIGILIIVSAISWMILMEILYQIWRGFIIDKGLYGTLLGGSLSILGFLIK